MTGSKETSSHVACSDSDPARIDDLAFDGGLAAAATAKMEGCVDAAASSSTSARVDDLVDGLGGATAAKTMEEGCEHVRVDVPYFDAAASFPKFARIGDDLTFADVAASVAAKMVDVPYFDAAASSSTFARVDDDLTFAGVAAAAAAAAKMVYVPYSDKPASSSIGLSEAADYSIHSPSPRHGDAVPLAGTGLNYAAPRFVRSSMESPSSDPGIINGLAAPRRGDAVPFAATGLNPAALPFARSAMGSSKLNPDAPSFEPTLSLPSSAANFHATRYQATSVGSSSASAANSFSLTRNGDDFLSRSAKYFSHRLPRNPPSNSSSPFAKPNTFLAPKTEATLPTLPVRLPVAGDRKTVLCKYWANTGSCARGADCDFAHGLDDMLKVDPRATYLHVYGSEGNCTDRASDARGKYKTRFCWYWRPADPMSCPLGANCLFAHGNEELRRWR